MCLRPITRKITSHGITKIVTHPCGKCLECVAQYQQDWAYRLSDEFKDWKFAYFGTFTYSNPRVPYVDVVPSDLPDNIRNFLCYQIEKIPFSSALHTARCRNDQYVEYLKPACVRDNISVRVPMVSKYDVQTFFKRLRINFKRKYHYEFLFKYFVCSEYGPQTLRPHYHIIIFTNEHLERVFSQVVQAYQYGDIRDFHLLKSRHGSISDACAYVAKYCCKPTEFENPYVVAGLIPKPFRLMSKGIGKSERERLVALANSYTKHQRGDYYGYDKKYLEWLDHQLHRLSYGKDNSVYSVKQPRYYVDKCFPQSPHYTHAYNAKKQEFEVRCTMRKNSEHMLCVAYTRLLEDRYIQLCNDKLSELRMQYPDASDNEIIHKFELSRMQNLQERASKKLQNFVKFYGKSFLNDF